MNPYDQPTQDQPAIPPVQSPRARKRSLKFWLLTGLAVLTALIALGGVASVLSPAKVVPAASTSKSVTSASAPAKVASKATKKAAKLPVPVPTVTVTAAPKPAVTVTAQPAAPAAPAADREIANFRGSDTSNTGSFTVPADGNYHLSYSFTPDQSFTDLGASVNFQVYEYTTDGTLENVLVNALSATGVGATALPVYADAAAGSTVYFSVISEATWNIVVLTGTS